MKQQEKEKLYDELKKGKDTEYAEKQQKKITKLNKEITKLNISLDDKATLEKKVVSRKQQMKDLSA